MNQKIIILIICILLSSFCKAQYYYPWSEDGSDGTIHFDLINFFKIRINSLNKLLIDRESEFVVFQPNPFKQIYYDHFKYHYYDSDLTFLLFKIKVNTFLITITKERIYGPILLKNSNIFNYHFIDSTAFLNIEHCCDLCLPLDCSSDYILYFNENKKYFFEYGESANTSCVQLHREKYRNEWFSIIKKETDGILDSLGNGFDYNEKFFINLNKLLNFQNN